MAHDQEFRLASQSILNVISELRPRSQQLSSSVVEMAENSHLQQIREEAIALIAEFCGKEVIDDLAGDAWKVWVTLAEDPSSNKYFDEIGDWMRATLENPQLLGSEDHYRRSEDLFNYGNELLVKCNQGGEFSRLLGEVQLILRSIREDTVTSALVEDFRALGRDLLLDENGRPNPRVTREALAEMKGLIISVLLEHLREIPIPKIEGSTPKYKYSIEDMVFYGYDIVPEQVRVNLETRADVIPMEMTTNDTLHSVLTFKLKNLKSHLRNLRFSFQRLKIPKIHDQGLLDFDIFGEDNKISIKWKLWYTRGQPTFELHRCRVHLRNIKIRITDSKHRSLENLIMKLFRESIRREIELRVSQRLSDMLRGIATKLNAIADRSNLKLHPSAPSRVPKEVTPVHNVPHQIIHPTSTKSHQR